MEQLMLDVGQANELKLAFRRAGFTNQDVKLLCEGDLAAVLLPVIRGNAKVVAIKHIINCDADPFLPEGWKSVEFHRKHGEFLWSPDKVVLYLTEEQKSGAVLGTDLRMALMGKPVLNANVLDYLLAHPQLIPKSWKGKLVFFLGTIYYSADGYLYVRYLLWCGDAWVWSFGWLGNRWGSDCPAAVLCE